MSPNTPDGFSDQPWIGQKFASTGILVLGESWYGDWEKENNSDQGYIQAYLDERLSDSMYTRMANACGMSREDFWQGVMFTNFVIWAGATRASRPTTHMYLDAYSRLQGLLVKHQPKGVWILGKGQAEFSSHLLLKLGIAYEIAPHPTSYGVKNETLRQSWLSLLAKMAYSSEGTAQR